MLEIRKATAEDKPEIWKIISDVIATGDTYTFAPDSSEEEMLGYWMSPEKHTYVAVWSEAPKRAGILSDDLHSAGEIVGTFFLKANQPGLGAHVGNAGYMVAPDAKGKGVGRLMAEYSLAEARRLGFRSMQFNFVVKSNAVAVKLWRDVGFEIIGEIPEAFNHARDGLINAYIMYRKL
ncbi:MAG TPA: N-acetyltransferase [Pyrinomonadaceae bacterium]|jgi:ribosomal protein S18 acetylase RimI-like enzyme